VALALQVGVNYANDYSDGVRGTDLDRVGPLRLTASGTASPGAVKAAAFAAFGVAALIGLALVVVTGDWWLLAVGAIAIAAAWGYTGGANPYGYRGLGEVGVFTFFGLVAVLGTTWTQAGQLSWPAWVGAVSVGLLACALLMVNNVRDVPTDALVGKRTLAVRIGESRARRAYAVMVTLPVLLGALCFVVAPWSLLVLLLSAPAVVLAVSVLAGARGRALVPVLAGTGMLELAYGVLLGLGLAL
ncbi:1,4-dihydroxy-2-naphthoate polyprenyltransferase, partial [Cellulomonas soli]|uniref:1,4-dihydroxy-2-naphthoate polyprenyltransferase n=1 Tax=Cellulomonas soli TaxID=931535 RepID=UPI003F864373